MRTLALTVTIAFGVLLTGCGSDDGSTTATPNTVLTSVAPTTDAEAHSTQTDAERIAVALEQAFAASSYPTDLAGARAAAAKEGLKPSTGNTIGGYVFDPAVTEFRLCVQNTTGAYAIYDTRPMPLREAGASGGCP